MRYIYKLFFSLIISVIVLGGIFMAGYYAGSGQKLSAASFSPVFGSVVNPEDVDLNTFWRVWQVLEEKFVHSDDREISSEEKIWGAIKGLTGSYGDPYTTFLTPEETEIFTENISGSFGGVGMEVALRDGILTVIAPLKNTPAEKAGIEAGDRIVRIDENVTQGMTVDEAILLIRGEVGTTVSLTILREGEERPLEISVRRGTIEIPTLRTELVDENTFLIELYNFSATSPELFNNALKEYRSSGADSLILDLRNNPGGYLEAAVDISSHFLPSGNIIVTEDFGNNGDNKIHRSKGYMDVPRNDEIVILVNSGSASASEILAGALKEHERATLVGTKTFGKGSVQELVHITDDTALKVTIARWVTPKGTSLSEEGLLPDIEIADDTETEEDEVLNRALQLLNE